MAIGWFGEDVIDWAGGVAGDVVDTAGDVLEVIPMAPELAGALRGVVDGPLRDFARTDFGMSVLRAMSTTLYGPLAWTIGPQVAALAFAVPGLARGEDFWTAWLTELSWRAEKTAEYVAPMASEALTPKIKEATEKVMAMIPYEDLRGIARSELARRLNVDEWTASMAMALAGLVPIPNRNEYDPVTGKPLAGTAAAGARTLGKRKLPGATGSASSGPVDPCVAAANAERNGQSFAIIRALRIKCYAAQDAARAAPVAIAADAPEETSSGPSAALLVGGALLVAGGLFLAFRSS